MPLYELLDTRLAFPARLPLLHWFMRSFSAARALSWLDWSEEMQCVPVLEREQPRALGETEIC